MATEKLLHVAPPRECNTQQTERLHATAHATGAQQPTLKALSGAVLERNNACNRRATGGQMACSNMSNAAPGPVALSSLRDRVELDELITVVARFHAFSGTGLLPRVGQTSGHSKVRRGRSSPLLRLLEPTARSLPGRGKWPDGGHLSRLFACPRCSPSLRALQAERKLI
jgi:hypothetical protein